MHGRFSVDLAQRGVTVIRGGTSASCTCRGASYHSPRAMAGYVDPALLQRLQPQFDGRVRRRDHLLPSAATALELAEVRERLT